MKTSNILFGLMACGSSCLGQVVEPDTVGYVQPWLNQRGQIVMMSSMLMDIRNVEFDTLQFWIEFRIPDSVPSFGLDLRGIRFRPTLGLPCYAIKGRDNVLGQVWEMYLPNRQRIETLLIQGFQTTSIVQTGQKMR